LTPDHRVTTSPRRGRALVLVAPVVVLALGSLAAPAAAGAPAPSTTQAATLGSTVVSSGPAPAAATAAATPGAASAPSPPPGGIQFGPALPTPSVPAGGGQPAGGSGPGSPGLFDITGHITAAINGWFTGLVTSALTPVAALLGRTLLATPDLAGQGRIGALWQLMVGIADALLVLLVLAGGAIVMSHETLQTRTAAKDIAPRIVVAAVAANASLALCGQAIALADSLSQAVLGTGVPPAGAGTVLSQLVVGSVSGGGIFLVLLGGVVAVLAIVLLATYVIRVAILVVLIVAAPLALVCHALPQTEALARLWWRAFAGCLAVQLGQSLVLITAVRVFLGSGGHANLGLASTGGLVDLLVAACLCWVLVRIPTWVGRAVFGPGHRGGPGRTLREVVLYKAVGAVKAGMAAAA